ncbi:type II toxin-antitoxin system prevent-host-death family antitoxin [Campylobacter ureolyticus]|jgi:prevent-host-death family protein|uniref:Antitoxin n=1 Tax=Campylobacter ureolyticus TaxID=827 RepID=A0A9Q4KQE9_9BACT|nr:type II toxin-antitoxin system prevent-host-death family antitoxin [Campylobacter ureolyticus]MCR8698938.1 type II toxin-antitoxin system Phd/YefM family antitoxin [Campylobacter ureolyticus]MCZ6103703.1 type II toxin-antitoxin system prevent-host-death family antitoxin [Campylobacter ureolyticus]MCZ6110966.1 type II toxin-antitoxin system prevent-host-death family antitoxin [Campylobacter ureolyticus]MCZ6116499.1 type II toxin-antitoxin system prevent-host-death family antitoxin [Campylobac
MPSFKQDEIYTATEVVRNFSAVLSKVSDGELKKAVIVKNNKFEAVMLSLKEYERLERAVELLDIVYSQKRHKDGN